MKGLAVGAFLPDEDPLMEITNFEVYELCKLCQVGDTEQMRRGR
jgi:hypothetical protein